jgi:hypothetical protein
MITEGDRPKPPELISLYAAIPAVFGTLKEEFQVGVAPQTTSYDSRKRYATALSPDRPRCEPRQVTPSRSTKAEAPW